MTQMETLVGRWEEIIKELSRLFEMRRGSVVEQFVETLRKDGTKARRGPYALYSYKEKARTVSRRLSDPELVETYRGQIQAFRRFQEIVQEMVSLGEEISEAAISEGREKKRLKSSSKRTKK
jgi:hypothetical protein